MRLALATVTVTTVLVFSICSQAEAGSPKSTSPVAKAADAMNPMNWSLPEWKLPDWSMPGKSEPPRIKKKRDSLLTTVTKTTSSGWQRTKKTLSPGQLFAGKDAPAKKPKSKSPGFFGNLFGGGQEPERIATVNEFLAQPQPGVGGSRR